MVRFSLVDSEVVLDRQALGRGGWLSRNKACAELAVARKSIPRALKTEVSSDQQLVFLGEFARKISQDAPETGGDAPPV